jgi:hypothetical protein
MVNHDRSPRMHDEHTTRVLQSIQRLIGRRRDPLLPTQTRLNQCDNPAEMRGIYRAVRAMRHETKAKGVRQAWQRIEDAALSRLADVAERLADEHAAMLAKLAA